MEVLFPLVRALNIDAREIFNPEMRRETPGSLITDFSFTLYLSKFFWILAVGVQHKWN